MTATLPGSSDTDTPPGERTLRLVVTAITDQARGIRGFTLAAPDGSPLPGFVPGSHLVVRTGAAGAERTNAYSLTSDGTHPSVYEISVLRVADGHGGSVWLHGNVAVGDTLTVYPPRSAFAPVARAAKHLLIAGGIGITPILSHLRAARRWGRSVQVLYALRPGAAAHIDEVVSLASPAAELFTTRADFITRLDAALRTQPLGTHLYVCGPAGLIDHVVTAATDAGWPASRVHFERFGIDALDAGDPFRVHLTTSRRTLDVPSGTSLLEALEDTGIAVPNLCRQGVCGECKIPVTAGAPVHRDLYLTDDEKNSGEAIMPCVSRAGDGCTLEVPL
ncbi:PDR/VanB family oxidoreductase [Gordonia sp. NPDC003429]